jgi:hypothetical protein
MKMFSKVLTKLVEYEKPMLVKNELYFSKDTKENIESTKKIIERIYKNKRSIFCNQRFNFFNKINKAIKTNVYKFLINFRKKEI